MKYLEKIQILLPLGYLYLIVLGLLHESIIYYQLGINIIKYSSITDILINPVSEIFTNLPLIFVLVFVIILFFIIQMILVKHSHKDWAKKVLGRERFSEKTRKKEIIKFLLPFCMGFIAFELLSIFVGMGLARGKDLSNTITKGDFTANYVLNFSSGKSKDVYMFDTNSMYCFYVAKGSKNIQIATVSTIDNIEFIDNKKLK
jgi:hypothetical protein